MIDIYYNFNFNHPDGITGSPSSYSAYNNNGLYNFNSKANQFDLNFAKLTLSHSPDPVGFDIDFGFGRTAETINTAFPEDTNGFQYVEQAFIELKPAKAKGFEIDFGKFVTSAGAEVIESYNNWNYSRSLLFTWAIPYYHMGVRTSWPMGKKWTGGFQLVNGWNDVSQTLNSGKTIGAVAALTTTKASWFINYYTGPSNVGTNTGWLNLIDTTLLLTPTGKWSKLNMYLNYDYDHKGNAVAKGPASSWYGIAGDLHEQLNAKWAMAQRFEWFDDPNGADLSLALPPAVAGDMVPQQVKEFTLTFEYKMLEGMLWRLEYRRDWSTYPMFLRGTYPDQTDYCNYNGQDDSGFFCANQEDEDTLVKAPDTGSGLVNRTPLPFPTPSSPGGEFPEILNPRSGQGLYGFSKSQNTLTLAFMAFFGPKR